MKSWQIIRLVMPPSWRCSSRCSCSMAADALLPLALAQASRPPCASGRWEHTRRQHIPASIPQIREGGSDPRAQENAHVPTRHTGTAGSGPQQGEHSTCSSPGRAPSGPKESGLHGRSGRVAAARPPQAAPGAHARPPRAPPVRRGALAARRGRGRGRGGPWAPFFTNAIITAALSKRRFP